MPWRRSGPSATSEYREGSRGETLITQESTKPTGAEARLPRLGAEHEGPARSGLARPICRYGETDAEQVGMTQGGAGPSVVCCGAIGQS